MGTPPRGKKKAKVAAGAGADRITALPIELRAHIASFLPYRQIVQLSALSRAWIHIHHHTPVVELNLAEFVLFHGIAFGDEDEDDEDALLGLVGDVDLVGLRVALRRRAQEGSGCTVDTLRIAYAVDDHRVRRHADRIIALVDAREIHVDVPYIYIGHKSRVAWTLDLPPAARSVDITVFNHLVPSITGPGAAALRELSLEQVVLREWPCLPSLRFLTLRDNVTVQAPFPPAAWCPMLEYLRISNSRIEQPRVDIRLQLLESLDLDQVDVSPDGNLDGSPFGDVIIDAPELRFLEMDCNMGCTAEFKSLTLRAPRLRYLSWRNQFAERVDIDVGSPGSVTAGTIQFEWEETGVRREFKCFEALVMQMLEGLIPELSPEHVAEAARPHTTLDKYTVEWVDSEEDGDMMPGQRITCNLKTLMSSLMV